MAGIPAKGFNEEIRRTIRDQRMIGELPGRRHQHSQLYESLKPIQVTEMLIRGR